MDDPYIGDQAAQLSRLSLSDMITRQAASESFDTHGRKQKLCWNEWRCRRYAAGMVMLNISDQYYGSRVSFVSFALVKVSQSIYHIKNAL